jgi:drug/metabolite transporter (DMT)-like permease
MDTVGHRPNRLGWLALALPPLLWAGNFVVGRAATAEVPPLMLAFARQLLALLVLLPFGWRAMMRDMDQYWQFRWQIVRVSLAGMVAYNVLVYVGLHSTTASNAQLMNSVIPVLIVMLGAVILRQRLNCLQVIGLASSCLGVLTIILHGDFARLLTLQFSHGDLIVFAAMVSFSLFSVWLRSFPAGMNRLGLLGAQLVVAVVVLLPFVAWEYLAGVRSTWSTQALGAMLYVGLAPSLLANLLYMFGIARVGPAKAGLFIHLVPLYGALMSVAFLGEKLHLYHVLGMFGILAGLACSQATGRRRADAHAAFRRGALQVSE